MSDIHRIKQILRFHDLHEQKCSTHGLDEVECDCFLGEDLWDMESDPPTHVESYRTADPWPPAQRGRRHIYADGRVRQWSSERGGPWIEIVK